jgi:hypothetical protein
VQNEEKLGISLVLSNFRDRFLLKNPKVNSRIDEPIFMRKFDMYIWKQEAKIYHKKPEQNVDCISYTRSELFQLSPGEVLRPPKWLTSTGRVDVSKTSNG